MAITKRPCTSYCLQYIKKGERDMNYEKVATDLLELLGGKENITYATFCLTRLRLTLKDRGLVDENGINQLNDIVGTKLVGSQYQIIIGPEVEHVYREFCKLANLQANDGIQEEIIEDLPSTKEKLTIKKIVNNVLDVVGACVTPMLPIITGAGIMKLIVAILGPSMLNILPVENDFMQLLTFVGDAGFYFFPVFVAYGASKKFQCNTSMSLLLAVILLHPTLAEIVAADKPFTVYGIPMVLTTYSTTFLPILLTVWVQSYVEKLLNRYIPGSLRSLLFPTLLILIMLPLELCILGPIGNIVGQGIASGVVWLHGVLGPVSIALIGATWPLLIATGMHQALIAIALGYIATIGYDNSILVGGFISNYPMIAIALAYLIKAKTAEAKGNALTGFITLALGGISEPTLFGIILRNKKALLYMLAGGLIGGFYAGLMNVAVYVVGSGNVLVALGFAGASLPNSLIHGIIASIIAFLVTFALCMIFGFENKELSK